MDQRTSQDQTTEQPGFLSGHTHLVPVSIVPFHCQTFPQDRTRRGGTWRQTEPVCHCCHLPKPLTWTQPLSKSGHGVHQPTPAVTSPSISKTSSQDWHLFAGLLGVRSMRVWGIIIITTASIAHTLRFPIHAAAAATVPWTQTYTTTWPHGILVHLFITVAFPPIVNRQPRCVLLAFLSTRTPSSHGLIFCGSWGYKYGVWGRKVWGNESSWGGLRPGERAMQGKGTRFPCLPFIARGI